MSKRSPPSALGHKFDPWLRCQQCGVRWWAHRRKSRPCPKPRPLSPKGSNG